MAVSSNPIKKIGGGPEPFYDYKFKGLSTDEKPTENVPSNSLFWELDTDEYYYFNKGSKEVIFIEEYTFDNWTQYGNGYLRYPLEITLSFGDKVKIMWDGQEYECTKQEGGLGYGYYGAPVDFSDPSAAIADFSVYPFGFYLNNEEGTAKVTISETDGSHTYTAYTESIVPDTWEKLATSSGGGENVCLLKMEVEVDNQTSDVIYIEDFLDTNNVWLFNGNILNPVMLSHNASHELMFEQGISTKTIVIPFIHDDEYDVNVTEASFVYEISDYTITNLENVELYEIASMSFTFKVLDSSKNGSCHIKYTYTGE